MKLTCILLLPALNLFSLIAAERSPVAGASGISRFLRLGGGAIGHPIVARSLSESSENESASEESAESSESSESASEESAESSSSSSSEEAPVAVVPCAGVIITEVMYDPTEAQGSDTMGEWVEILNYSCESVDLAGWQIQDNFGTDTLESGDDIDNMVLGPGQYAVIIDKDSQVRTSFTIDPNARIFVVDDNQIGNQLADTGDEVNLLDGMGATVDAFAYDDTNASGCGTAAKENGYTLERKDPFEASDCANFDSNVVRDAGLPIGGTPGYVNNLWEGESLPMPCVCE